MHQKALTSESINKQHVKKPLKIDTSWQSGTLLNTDTKIGLPGRGASLRKEQCGLNELEELKPENKLMFSQNIAVPNHSFVYKQY